MNPSTLGLRMCSSDESFGPFVKGCRDNFDFTLRFEHVFLSIIPSILFIVASTCRAIQLSGNPPVVGGKRFQWVKLGVIAVYSASQLALLVLFSKSRIRSHNTAVGAAELSLFGALISLGLSWMEHSRSLRSSNLFNFYLLLTLLFDMAQTRTHLTISFGWPLGQLFTAGTILKGVIVLLESYPKTQWAFLDQISPETRLGMYSIATYAWLHPLLQLGSRKMLDLSDLYPLDPHMASKQLDSKFWATWTRTSSWGGNTRLIVTILRTMKWQLLAPIPPRLAKIVFDFSQPFLIQAVQSYLSRPRTDASARESGALIGATVLVYFGRALSMGIYQYYNQRATACLRGFLVAAIYRKTLTLDLSADDSNASVTLMSTDVERVQAVFRSIHEIWANTIEFALGAWLLYFKLGLAFLVPISIVLICFLGTLAVGKATPPLQGAWVAATQRRIGATANLITNMKGLKILGLENKLGNLIHGMRETEIAAGANFRKTTIYAAIFALSPLMLSPVLTFAATSENVNAKTAFTSLSLLILLTNPLGNLFQLMPTYIAAAACFSRIATYLATASRFDYRSFGIAKLPTQSDEVVSTTEEGIELSQIMPIPGAVHSETFLIEDGYFGWSEGQYVLKQINLAIPSSKLTLIVGPVGCGKSTMCKALLGEVPYAKGRVFCSSKPTRIGFCDQAPFLPNASIRGTIIGGDQFDKEWYNKVVEATALSPDIETFANGDHSIVGPNGSNLSGGQRHRLAIARAIYAQPTVFIFDDVFSGLDATTESIVFRKVFGPDGLLRQLGATILLCTHALKYLPLADHIVVLGVDGRIVKQGTFEKLGANQNDVHCLEVQGTVISSGGSDTHSAEEAPQPPACLSTTKPELDDYRSRFSDVTAYKQYLSAFGRVPLSFFIILSLISASCNNFATIWLKIWSDYNTQHPHDKAKRTFYLAIYATLQILGLVCASGAITITNIILVKRSGRTFHLRAIRTLVAAPISLFSRIPPGALLNRFAQDLNIVDTELELHFADLVLCIAISIGMAAVIATASPYVAMLYPAFGGVLYVLQRFYLRTSRQLRFLDLETKSPLFTHFLETLSGLPTIRAFGWTNSRIISNHALVDASQRPSYLLLAVQAWLNMVLAVMVATLAICTVALATQLRGNIGFIGASLVSLMSFNNMLTSIVTRWTLLEIAAGAVSRLESFSNTVTSEHRNNETVRPRENWPRYGTIKIKNVSACYIGQHDESRSDKEGDVANDFMALRNISLTINAREKVAIVGRTGSGKSSIILLLLRLLDPLSSNDHVITIDDIPLQNIDRNILRSRILAIPQDSFFLPDGNSYRANLDPYEKASATECELVLKEVGLWALIKDRGGLDEPMRSDTLSQGQKQLFSIARTVLRARERAKLLPLRTFKSGKGLSKPGGILLLDEVTSNVDDATDTLIQRIIREEFAAYTVIAVAHREDTLRDFDRKVVMENGMIKEDQSLGER